MIEGGQVFRRAWVDGVRKHFSDTGYVALWSELPEWERASANEVYALVRAFVEAGGTEGLSRVQKGRFVALCWSAQANRHGGAPAADWDQLSPWQRETNADVFEHIEGLIIGVR
ncbi:hypothetical protein [Actinokineospora diospyrosa]|uniref:Uncharacterized protein n=1 Tax=Actinokineospora diospyrosa TaxID=103728 RepID=A0ABT1IGK9_9PSEU|nr:hypothetical protein [Actinokineospora diospyrosa]MCP2271778.1 hypothetical protein [Actinokineospora diospyrosa]